MEGVKVLLVDDNRENRIACSLALRQLGFEIKTACEGQEALDTLDGYEPDVIMLDLRMPGMDGWKFLENYHGPVPIVVVSAWWDDCPLPGHPFAVMTKPADMREVAVIMRQATRSWR
jgi:CheY-like chemotaxis protein